MSFMSMQRVFDGWKGALGGVVPLLEPSDRSCPPILLFELDGISP